MVMVWSFTVTSVITVFSMANFELVRLLLIELTGVDVVVAVLAEWLVLKLLIWLHSIGDEGVLNVGPES